MAETPSIDALLENATWLRGLARSMLADRGLADDALQETWVAALRERPEAGSERSWLARVLRNFALQRIRAESARSSREQRASRSEHLPGADEIVARAELHARLVQAVLSLDEPYRATILWRYFEGLSAEEIARRARIEPATVRSRVARAREKLRATLMSKGGEAPERWLEALLPFGARLVEVPTGITAGVLAAVGGGLMKAKLILGAASIALFALWLVHRGTTAQEAASLTQDSPAAPGQGSEDASLAHDQELLGVPRRLAVDAAPAANAASGSALLLWQGIVLSEDGRAPIEGARIAYRRGSEIGQYTPEERESRTRDGVRSDAQGRFALEISAKIDEGLWVEAEGYFPFKFSGGDLPRASATPIEFVLAPLGKIELEIVDETSKPYAGMDVQYMIDVNRGSQDYMWSFRGWRRGGSTDAGGRVTLDKLPCGMPISLQRSEGSGRTDFLGSAVHIDPRLRVLRHQVKLGRTATLTGRLEFPDGHPADLFALAWQSYPLDYDEPISARTGEDGRFSIAGVPAKAGELQFEFPGAAPIRLTPQLGETKDLGTIVVSKPLVLAARLTSRWFDGASMEQALDGVEVRAFRAGRALAGAGRSGSALKRTNNEFSAQVTDGPLEIVVSRGGFFFSGIAQPGEILVRLQLPGPRQALEISLDEHTGALDLQLGERRPAAGEAVKLGLDTLDAVDPKPYPFTAEGIANDAGLVRFAVLPCGRFRCSLQLGDGDSASIDEVAIVAGQCTSVHAPEFSRFAMTGVVRNARGEPVAKANVGCRSRKDVKTATDADGHFRFDGLSAGIYDLEVSHGDFGTRKLRDVRVLSAKDPPIEIVLGGFASLVGHVHAAGDASKGLAVMAQPVDSNDSYNSITDDQGTFRLERLPGCRLRVWASDKFMEIHDLAAGEAREIEIELGLTTQLHFTRNGEPIEDLDGARALAFDESKLARSEWRLAQLHGSAAELDLPSGRVLFDVTRARSGSNESFLALVDHPGATVELARKSITIESATAWNGPLPRAMLLSIEGREVVSMWGGVIVLATERDDLGRVIVPCLPEGSRVRLRGFDSRGQRFEQIVDVAEASVRWP